MTSNNDSDAAADALLEASRALVGVAARSLADVDVTLPQFRALVVLSRPAPVTVGDLAKALDVHPTTATRLCDRLVRKRLVRRHPGVGADRRETILSLSAPGRRLVDRVTARRRRDLAAIVERMDRRDRQAVVEALTAFARAAGERFSGDPFGWVDPDLQTSSGRG
jgi:DNA-binding MarR family transcriptional regulator